MSRNPSPAIDDDISELTGKAADRRFLESIQPVIERAAREGHERGILKSTIEAQKRLAAEKRLEREAKLAAAVSIIAAKEKERGGRKNAAQEYNGPTPERGAKLMGVVPIAPPIGTGDKNTITKAHLAQGVVEFYSDRMKAEHLQGARYLAQVGHKAGAGQPRVTGSYEGTPGTAFGPRRGGVAAHALDAHNELLNVEAIITSNFGPEGRYLLRWLWDSVEMARDGMGLREQMAVLGKSIAPWVKDPAGLAHIAHGSLLMMFRFAYSNWVVKEQAMQRRESTPQQIEMRRAIRRHKMVKEGLLDADRDGPAFKREEKA